MSFPFDGSVSHLQLQQSQWEFSLSHNYVAAITFSFSRNLHLLQFFKFSLLNRGKPAY